MVRGGQGGNKGHSALIAPRQETEWLLDSRLIKVKKEGSRYYILHRDHPRADWKPPVVFFNSQMEALDWAC